MLQCAKQQRLLVCGQKTTALHSFQVKTQAFLPIHKNSGLKPVTCSGTASLHNPYIFIKQNAERKGKKYIKMRVTRADCTVIDCPSMFVTHMSNDIDNEALINQGTKTN